MDGGTGHREEPTTYGTQRRAAARNRDAILAAAHDALAEAPDASMNEIAKRAGVGAGTLYRHFPTREALLLGVYHHEVETLCARVSEVLADRTPEVAFVDWFEELAGYVRIKHGLGAALQSPEARAVTEATYPPVTAAIAELLAAGVGAGTVRPDVRAGDVLEMMGFLWRTPGDPEGLAQGRRITGLVLDALRPREPG